MSNREWVKLNDEQIASLREIFRSFNWNKDGSLMQLELGLLLRLLGLKLSPKQLEALIQKAITNSNGLVEFCELVALSVAGAPAGQVTVHGGATEAALLDVR
ncbi:hypothetical protein NL676_032959 [Syzygium grande]|nr:hypothetical protein NL676_032959 [Syzygium grande]